MSLLPNIFKKKEASPIVSVLPEEIYQAGVLELKDVIAPSALKVSISGLAPTGMFPNVINRDVTSPSASRK